MCGCAAVKMARTKQSSRLAAGWKKRPTNETLLASLANKGFAEGNLEAPPNEEGTRKRSRAGGPGDKPKDVLPLNSLLGSGYYPHIQKLVMGKLGREDVRNLSQASAPIYRTFNKYDSRNNPTPWRGEVERFYNTPGEIGSADPTKVPDWTLDDILAHISSLGELRPWVPHGTTRKQAAVITQVKKAIANENPATAQRRVLETFYPTPPVVRFFAYGWGEALYKHKVLLFEPMFPQFFTMGISVVFFENAFSRVQIFFYDGANAGTDEDNPNYPPWGNPVWDEHTEWEVSNSEDFKDDPGFGTFKIPIPANWTDPGQLVQPTLEDVEALRLRLFLGAKIERSGYNDEIGVSLILDLILQVLIPDGIALELQTFEPHRFVHTRVVDAAA